MSIQYYKNSKDRIKQTRSLYPAAFALSVNEALRLANIDKIIYNFFEGHRSFIQYETNESGLQSKQYLFNDESIGLLKSELKRGRVSLKNTRKLANDVLNGKWFEVYPLAKLNESDNDKLAFATDKTSIEIADRDKYPELYRVWSDYKISLTKIKRNVYAGDYEHNPEALRIALNLSEDYLFLCQGERDTLQLILDIAEYKSKPFTTEGYIQTKNTPQTVALSSVGKRALKEGVSSYDDTSGDDIFTLVTTTGAVITILGKEVKPNTQEFINMDKLYTHINHKFTESGFTAKEITITLNEFMELRGLTDKKEAREQFKKGISDLYNASIDVSGFSVRFIQDKSIIKNSAAAFTLSDKLFNSLKKNSSIDYRPVSFMRLNGNAYMIAAYLHNHRRRNIGKPTENRVSIRTLLEATLLPLASDTEPRRYKSHIIEPFFTALNTAADTGEFTYKIVKSNGIELSEHENFMSRLEYSDFIKYLIQIQWVKEPEYFKQLRESKQTKHNSKS